MESSPDPDPLDPRIISRNLPTISRDLGQTSWDIATISRDLGQTSWNIATISRDLGQTSWNIATISRNLGQTSWNTATISRNLGQTSWNIATICWKTAIVPIDQPTLYIHWRENGLKLADPGRIDRGSELT